MRNSIAKLKKVLELDACNADESTWTDEEIKVIVHFTQHLLNSTCDELEQVARDLGAVAAVAYTTFTKHSSEIESLQKQVTALQELVAKMEAERLDESE